jgi:hypothetical protein
MTLPSPRFAGLLALLALLFSRGHAQPVPGAQGPQPLEQQAREQAVMAQTTLVFEGELVRAVGYFNADSSRVFRTAVIRLTHSLKGALVPGTVQVVYKGTKVAGLSKDPKTGETWVVVPSDNGHGQVDNQGLTLPSNKPVLFFCRPLPIGFAPKPPHLATTNRPALEIVGVAFDIFRNHSVLSDVGGRFANFLSLYQYLEATYHLQHQW